MKALALLWGALLIAANLLLFRYQGTAGEPALAPALWPTQSGMPLDSHQATLLMFVHPSCECTESSLRELCRLLPQTRRPLAVYLVVSLAPGMDQEWITLSTLKTLQRSPGVHVVMDRGLLETDRFGVRTSGDVLLYSAQCRLLFSGGITPSRAHEGSARGQRLLLEAIQNGSAARQTQVFGCPLHNPDEFCSARPAPQRAIAAP